MAASWGPELFKTNFDSTSDMHSTGVDPAGVLVVKGSSKYLVIMLYVFEVSISRLADGGIIAMKTQVEWFLPLLSS